MPRNRRGSLAAAACTVYACIRQTRGLHDQSCNMSIQAMVAQSLVQHTRGTRDPQQQQQQQQPQHQQQQQQQQHQHQQHQQRHQQQYARHAEQVLDAREFKIQISA